MKKGNTLQKIRKLLNLSKSKQSYKVNFYAEATLEDGRVIATEDEELVVGSELRVIAEDGSAELLVAGNYILSDGTTIVVDENSVVTTYGEEEVVEEEMQEEVSEDEEKGIADAAADETVMTPETVANVANAINDATGEEVTAEIAEEAAVAAIAAIEAEIPAVVEEVKEELSKEETFSAIADLVEEKFNEVSKRLTVLEDQPASKGVIKMPRGNNNTQQKPLGNMTLAQRVEHVMKSN